MVKITANFIIQIAGKPKKAVEDALKTVMGNIKKEEDMEIIDSQLLEPELTEDKILYSGLINLQAEFDDLERLFGFVYDYLPVSVEVEDPEKIDLTAHDLNVLLNLTTKNLLEYMHKINNLSIYVNQLKEELVKYKK